MSFCVRALCGILFLLSVCSQTGFSLAQSPPLVILTEEFPPFNFTSQGKLRGISTDVLRLILKDTGIDARMEDIQVLPWTRAYHMVLAQPDTMLYSVTRTPEREESFKWIGPIAPNRNVLIALTNSHIHINGIADLANYRVGAIRDDAGEQLLISKGFPEGKIELAPTARANMLKLESGRIDVFAYPETTFRWVLAQSGRNIKDFESVYVLHDGEVYFACNPDTPDDIVARMQASLDKLRASGELQAIVDSYLGR